MNKISELKKRLAMTQEQFAEFCSVSRSSIARYEAGEKISRQNAEKIASACNVSIDYLLGKGSTQNSPSLQGDELRESVVNLILELPARDLPELRSYAEYLKSRHEKG